MNKHKLGQRIADSFQETSNNQTYSDSKSVAVRDFIVDDGLNVDGFQLEVNGNIYKPGHKTHKIEYSERT